jgi:hypothetical protein
MMFGYRLLVALVAATLGMVTGPLTAQDQDPETLLDDFIHYALIANVGLAESNALALSRSSMPDEAFFELVTQTRDRATRFDQAVGWALYVERLEPLASALEKKFERGRLELARDESRLAEAIEMLDGTTRQRMLAESRLKAAGEYAVPPLLWTLSESPDARTSRAVTGMLAAIGADAVGPLNVALPNLDPDAQVLVIGVLAEIGYSHAGPALASVARDDNAYEAARSAAANALARLGVPLKAGLSTLYTVQAMQYFDGQASLVPQAHGHVNNFWTWDPMSGLVSRDVPEAVFDDVMAMVMASKALGADPANAQAMSIFVAANLRRQRELRGGDDLVYGDLAYSPEFYATVFGPQVAQQILTMAMDRGDSALALDAITAIGRTAGAEAVLTGGNQPLVEAMFYPDRRVQYESALAVAGTLPSDSFEGSYRVVPLLASAVRSGDQLYAIVIGGSEEDRRKTTTSLEAMGWSVVGQAEDAPDAVDAAGAVPGIDLAVVHTGLAEQAMEIADWLGAMTRTTATPVLLLTQGAEVHVLDNELGGNDMAMAAHSDISDQAMAAVLEDLLASAAGGRLDAAEAEAFSARALSTLRDIALADTVLSIHDAIGALVDALGTADGATRDLIAETLAMIDADIAQQTLIDAAMHEGDLMARIVLLDQAAASVRRWGNLAEDWQVEAVMDLAESTAGPLADAAARLNGALNHPGTSAMMFLP